MDFQAAPIPDLRTSSFWHPYTPIPHLGPRARIVRGEGAYLIDDKGKRLFDATSSWWCQVHGHSHPRLVKALSRQAEILDQVLVSPHTHPVAESLSDALVAALGAPFEKVFFSDNGSTAVEVALKMALQFWQLTGTPRRKKFLSLDMGYHGDTFGAMSVACPPDFTWAFTNLSGWSVQAPAPYYYRRALSGETPAAYSARAAEAAVALMREHAEELAAVVLEPLVMGAGGLVTYEKEYLSIVMAEAKRLGILVILDEVFTGFGRTGKMFAFEHVAERPDIVCLSKGLTSGMLPLAATLTTRAVFEPFVGGEERRLAHGHTFTANAISCAVALESLRIFEEDSVMERVAESSAFMRSQRDRMLAAPHVGEVRHLGMIFAMELVRDKQSRELFEPANGYGWRVAEKLWERGIWVRPLRQVLYVVSPYCATKEDLQACFDKLEEVLHEPL